MRCAESRVETREDRRQKAVAAHRVKDARLAEQIDEDDAGDAADRADVDDGRQPFHTGGLYGESDRRWHVQLRVRNESSHHQTNGDVEHGADRERREDSKWDGPTRI